MTAPSTAPFLARHDFLIRRLHSLSGLIPVGAYMCIHLATNAGVLNGARSFQRSVDAIHSLGIALPVVEWTFIFLPILFHAIVGVAIIRSGVPNTGSYALVGNVRYYLQRATAWIALIFIFFHVFQLHGWIKPVAHRFWGAQFSPLYATSSAADAIQRSLFIEIFYVVGVLACVFHLANGLWTMGITWGVWTTPAAQRRANFVCAAFGLLLAAVGIGAMYGMFTVNVQQAYEVEEKINAEKIAAGELTTEEVDAEKPHFKAHEQKPAEGAQAEAPAPADGIRVE